MEILDTLFSAKYADMYCTIAFLVGLTGSIFLYAIFGPDDKKKKKAKKPLVSHKVLERTKTAATSVTA